MLRKRKMFYIRKQMVLNKYSKKFFFSYIQLYSDRDTMVMGANTSKMGIVWAMECVITLMGSVWQAVKIENTVTSVRR